MIKKWLVKLQDKIWLIPALYSLIAISLASALAVVDFYWSQSLTNVLPSIFFTEVPLAQTILSGLSTSLLTMTTFTFSTIMVVLTTYASQFSPRTLKNFITDKMTLHVLGIFLGGFIYPTLSLLFMKNSLEGQLMLSATVGVLIAIICLAFFAIFIHHVATSIQVSSLINRLTTEADGVIRYYCDLQEKDDISSFSKEYAPVAKTSVEIKAGTSGYIQFADYDTLFSLTKEHQIYVHVNCPIGTYVNDSNPLLTVTTKNGQTSSVKDIEHELSGCFIIEKERDIRQDPVYALQKIVEVALRAISPGINDPNTANDCIRHLGKLLGQISQLPDEGWVYINEDNEAYVRFSLPPFKEILHRTFFQLRHYGKADVSVLEAMLDSLHFALENSSKKHHQDIVDMQHYVMETIDLSDFPTLDQELIKQRMQETQRLRLF